MKGLLDNEFKKSRFTFQRHWRPRRIRANNGDFVEIQQVADIAGGRSSRPRASTSLRGVVDQRDQRVLLLCRHHACVNHSFQIIPFLLAVKKPGARATKICYLHGACRKGPAPEMGSAIMAEGE